MASFCFAANFKDIRTHAFNKNLSNTDRPLGSRGHGLMGLFPRPWIHLSRLISFDRTRPLVKAPALSVHLWGAGLELFYHLELAQETTANLMHFPYWFQLRLNSEPV